MERWRPDVHICNIPHVSGGLPERSCWWCFPKDGSLSAVYSWELAPPADDASSEHANILYLTASKTSSLPPCVWKPIQATCVKERVGPLMTLA